MTLSIKACGYNDSALHSNADGATQAILLRERGVLLGISVK